jgi:hypothetical protein
MGPSAERSNGNRDAVPTVVGAAGVAAIAGGIVAAIGSASTWGACPQDPCGADGLGLQVVLERTGLALGFGLVTLVLALVAVLLAIPPVARATAGARPTLLLATGGGIVGAVIADVLYYYVVDQQTLVGSPWFGAYLTAFGGLLVFGAGILARRGPPRSSSRGK